MLKVIIAMIIWMYIYIYNINIHGDITNKTCGMDISNQWTLGMHPTHGEPNRTGYHRDHYGQRKKIAIPIFGVDGFSSWTQTRKSSEPSFPPWKSLGHIVGSSMLHANFRALKTLFLMFGKWVWLLSTDIHQRWFVFGERNYSLVI